MSEDEPLVAESRDVRDDALAWADDRLASLARGRVLDVGCGEGRFLRDGWIGVDVERGPLRFARLRSPLVAVADAHRLPFRDGVFDTVLAFRMLNAADAIDAALAELRRVLAGGGALLVLTIGGVRDTALGRVDATVRDRRGGDRLDETNGAERLRRFFPRVRQEQFARRFRFDDAAAALDHYARVYVHRGNPDASEILRRFETARDRIRRLPLPIDDERRATLFVAELD